MGNFYTNLTLRGPKPEAVAAALAGRNAMVTPEKNGCVVVYDELSDFQNTQELSSLAESLSATCKCPVLAVLNHDDDVLWYQLWAEGDQLDEYDSCPGYFGAGDSGCEPKGGNADVLCGAFGSEAADAVDAALHPSEEDGDPTFVFAVQRHQALVKALGLSDYAVGLGFMYASSGDLPPDLSENNLLRTSAG